MGRDRAGVTDTTDMENPEAGGVSEKGRVCDVWCDFSRTT